MIKITLPDGSIREFAQGVTPMEVAKNISEGFARNVISASFNGRLQFSLLTLSKNSFKMATSFFPICLAKRESAIESIVMCLEP